MDDEQLEQAVRFVGNALLAARDDSRSTVETDVVDVFRLSNGSLAVQLRDGTAIGVQVTRFPSPV